MNILKFDYDKQHGFAWIILEDNLIVQACITNNDEIVMHDCGQNWGQCGDANYEAFEKWGENRCMKALFAKAKECGFKLIKKKDE